MPPKQPRNKRKLLTVMAFGTFDILHPGHLHFLNQAKRLGGRLVVSVARDSNVQKFKGASPLFSETERLRLVSCVKGVDRVVLGGAGQYLPHVLKEKPDIIALGYDQQAYMEDLNEDIKHNRLKVRIVRLKPYKARKYKSSVYKNLIRRYS